MSEKKFNNADSFAMSFDDEWENIECSDINLKIKTTNCTYNNYAKIHSMNTNLKI